MKDKKEVKYFNPIQKGKFRNKPCVCHSGKKVKNCCGMKDTLTKFELDKINDLIRENQRLARS